MSGGHKTVHDYVTTVKSMTAEAFSARFPHPFLFGREVLEEEFRFSTLVTDDKHLSEFPKDNEPTNTSNSAPTDVFRIRHWVIAVKKPAEAPAQDRVFLGRSETNDLCVPHKTVSKLHAYFQRETGAAGIKWSVVDTGSANGTKHNGLRVPARAKVAILDSDTLVFGRCVFQWMSARSLYERVLTFAG
jgi:hypothetical protein